MSSRFKAFMKGFKEGMAESNLMICPNVNCGYKGKIQKKARGSVIIGLILCCCFLLPGILYFMFMSGYRYYCPKCRMQVSSDN